MGNNKQPQTVTIDDKTYDIEQMTQEQRTLLDHCIDLDRKLASCGFQMDQLRIGKDAFMGLLKNSLAQPEIQAAQTVEDATA